MAQKISLIINGQPIAADEGATVLQAARQNGIVIPTLCDHPDLHPYGGCRLCVVEVKGARFPMASCQLPVSEGMEVTTESRTLRRQRKAILTMILSTYHDSGYQATQQKSEFMYWVRRYGISPKKFMAKSPRFPVDADPNPFLWVDLNKCIVCTRCIRACADVQGRFVWSLAERGINTRIVAGADTDLLSARCESCGACAAYCPTGALDHKMSINLGAPDRLVTTTCTYCGVGCQFDLNVKNNRIIRVTSNPNAPVNGMHLCVKGRYGYDFVHHPDRLTRPRVRRYLLEARPRPEQHSDRTEWVEVDWDTALDITARKLARLRDAHGADSIGVLTSAKCLNEENYLMNKFARQALGTNNIDHCARL
jgi:formate dehydrogenase major subunit/formate dehydrogenase alpha subunit